MTQSNEEFLYSEDESYGNKYREEQLEQYTRFIEGLRRKADIQRTEYFKPDFTSVSDYQRSVGQYRKDFLQMLGWPLAGCYMPAAAPEAFIEFVAEDSLGKIYRLNIRVLNELTAYGLLFIPDTPPPYPLVVALHGGQGTPELCSGFFGSSNYNDMTRRVLKKGAAVFVPQLQLWGSKFGPDRNRDRIDVYLKQLGSSIAAVEIIKISRCLDYLTAREDIDCERIGTIGLSYGGFYSLFTAAADERIKVTVSSCFFNNRYRYIYTDWVWFNSAGRFLDAEICALICPRALYIEVGKNDDHFDVKNVDEVFDKVKSVYSCLGLENKLGFKKFEGSHELDPQEDGINFLYKWLT